MGVVTLPDWGAQLGHALAQLGSGAANIANPHHEFQEKFREAITADSSIMQRLADLTLTNGFLPPGIARLIPRDLQDAIFSMEASPEAHKRKAAVDAIGNFTPAERVAFSRGEALGMAPSVAATELAVAPEIPKYAQADPGTVPITPAAQGAIRALSGLTSPQLQAGSLQGQLLRDANTFYAKLPPGEREKLGADASIDGLMNDRHFMASLQAQYDLHRASTSREAENIAERYRRMNAEWAATQTGTGNIDEWYTYLYDSKARQHARDAATGKVDSTEQDTALQEIDRAHKLLAPSRRRLMLNRTTQGVKELEDHINGRGTYKGAAANDELRPRYIQELNALLQERQLYGGPPVRAVYDKPTNVFSALQSQGGVTAAIGALGRMGTSERLMYVTGTGKQAQEVPPETVWGPVNEPDTTPSNNMETARTRALELQRQGLSRNAIRIKMRAEGFNVQ